MSIIGDIWEEDYYKLSEEKKQLEAKILDFYKKLENRSFKMDAPGGVYAKIAKEYKEYFEITTERQGKYDKR